MMTEADLRRVVEPLVKDHFLDLFDLTVRRRGSRLFLTVVLDKPEGSVTLSECEQVSLELEKQLDASEWTDESWVLEVASPGLDRPLRHPADWRRFYGRLARVVLEKPLPQGAVLLGRLSDVSGETVYLETHEGEKIPLTFSEIKEARLEVEFGREQGKRKKGRKKS